MYYFFLNKEFKVLASVSMDFLSKNDKIIYSTKCGAKEMNTIVNILQSTVDNVFKMIVNNDLHKPKLEN